MVFLLVETEVYNSKKADDSLTVKINEALSVRVYSDNKPCCLETAMLQKGLVLIYNDKELIEEGIGFGVPVVKYADKTLFSSTAKIITSNDPRVFEKHYALDTVSTKRFYKTHVNDAFYEAIHKLFEKAYLGHQTMQPLNNKIMELRELLKIKTEFHKIKPRGTVKIRYTLLDDTVEVFVDFSSLNLTDCTELLVLNEQGANTFTNYKDTDGLLLLNGRIGAWDAVSAKRATLTTAAGNLAFFLEPVAFAKLFRGWEKTKNRFSWAGLSYSIEPSRKCFDYKIGFNC
jgi:hypothetical protein